MKTYRRGYYLRISKRDSQVNNNRNDIHEFTVEPPLDGMEFI